MKSMKHPNAWGIRFRRWQVVMLTKHPDGKQVKVRIESVESTGEKGGAQTGQKMTHYIDQSGPFRDAFLDFAEIAEHQLYVELWDESSNREASKKAASKTKYTCPDCGCNAWAKPQTRLRCGECNVELEGPPEADGDGEESSN